jgi:alpha-beta hydrolase superfamily lysophospholipase
MTPFTAFILCLIVLVLAVFALVVIFQHVFIFPGVLFPTVERRGVENYTPDDAEVCALITPDGESIEYWRLEANPAGPLHKEHMTALLFHGNGGFLGHFACFQEWFRDLGVTSYALDYRGYGGSTGRPTEKNVLADADLLWDEVRKREKALPQSIIVFGQSIGTGVAAWLAGKMEPLYLILLSPYVNLKEVARSHKRFGPFFPILKPFFRFNFPNRKFLNELGKTSLILVHGHRDELIPFHHSVELEEHYGGRGRIWTIYCEESGHNDLFDQTKDRLADVLLGVPDISDTANESELDE